MYLEEGMKRLVDLSKEFFRTQIQAASEIGGSGLKMLCQNNPIFQHHP